MSQYTECQVKAAYDNAELLGFTCPSDAVAVQFLDWWHANKTEYSSMAEARRIGLAGLSTNGLAQQTAFWEEQQS